MISLMSRCRRFVDRTGMGHIGLVDKLLLGHTVRLERSGVGSTGHYQDSISDASAG